MPKSKVDCMAARIEQMNMTATFYHLPEQHLYLSIVPLRDKRAQRARTSLCRPAAKSLMVITSVTHRVPTVIPWRICFNKSRSRGKREWPTKASYKSLTPCIGRKSTTCLHRNKKVHQQEWRIVKTNSSTQASRLIWSLRWMRRPSQ